MKNYKNSYTIINPNDNYQIKISVSGPNIDKIFYIPTSIFHVYYPVFLNGDDKKRLYFLQTISNNNSKYLELFIEFATMGLSIVDKAYHQKWFECVISRIIDLHDGRELNNCLKVIRALNNQESFAKSKLLFNRCDFNGCKSIVLSIIQSCCTRGRDFVDYYTETYEN